MALLSKAFAHPARVAIMEFISKEKEANCEDIAEGIRLSQPTTSQHLAVIKKAGLLKEDYNGKLLLYSINVSSFEDCTDFMSVYLKKLSGRLPSAE